MKSSCQAWIVLTFAVVVVAGCAATPTTSKSQHVTPDSASPASSISKDRAIELAREHTTATSLVSVTSGPFAALNTDSRIGAGYPIAPDDLVWAVTFAGNITICDPNGVCYSPRPSTTTVYLEYATGAFRTSDTFSAGN